MSDIYFLSQFYKVLGDETRLRILQLLLVQELCVGDIARMLAMSHSAISHQLQVLRQSNLVSVQRRGKEVYYRLSDEHVRIILKYGFEHIQEGVCYGR